MSIEISVDKKWSSIAVALSGGADSAMLTYLICSQITKKDFVVHIINNIRCWKTKPWQQDDVKKVINWLMVKFPNIKFKVHTNFVPPELEWGDKGRTIVDEYGKLVSGDTLELRSFAEYVCCTENVDAYYNGVTRNPREMNFDGLPTRDIDKTSENAHLEYMVHMGKHVYHPFRFTEKTEIVKMYKELGLLDLFAITRSCEGEFSNITYKTYQSGQDVPVCGECFWCKEREWAVSNVL